MVDTAGKIMENVGLGSSDSLIRDMSSVHSEVFVEIARSLFQDSASASQFSRFAVGPVPAINLHAKPSWFDSILCQRHDFVHRGAVASGGGP